MGLDISSKSKLEYHYSYSGIHYIRFMAYRTLGGKKTYSEWYHMHYQSPYYVHIEVSPIYYESDEADKESSRQFPNLLFHSDCDGAYTLDGKVGDDNDTELLTGNSHGLLTELEFIKANLPPKYDPQITDRDWYIFNMLYKLVKDVVENHDGVVEFH